jgi:hypothetical protein
MQSVNHPTAFGDMKHGIKLIHDRPLYFVRPDVLSLVELLSRDSFFIESHIVLLAIFFLIMIYLFIQ